MADPTHLAELLKGVESWNAWREAHPEIEHPDLSEVDFTAKEYKNTPLYTKDDKGNLFINLRDANLQGSILNSVNLQGATLISANLKSANLGEANLNHAYLYMTNLHGAYLQKAKLEAARIVAADLEWALLMEASLARSTVCANLQRASFLSANLYGANLSRSNLYGADFWRSNLEGADVTRVKFSRSSCQRKFQGIRVSTCYGNQIFKTFAQDQDYIETLRASGRLGEWKFRIWYITSDCGRSFLWWAGWSVGIAILFGLIYFLMGPGHIRVDPPLPFSWLTMIYYSVVTFTTLGFGDIKPATETAAMVVMLEVILGYIMLGGLVAILANKVARRS